MEIRLEKKILLVDDEIFMREYWNRELFAAGFEVLVAPDAKTALEIAENESIDLIITDMLLPGMDGMVLCEKIRRMEKLCTVPIILISGVFKDYEFRSKISQGIADAFLLKPIDKDMLLSKIRSLLSLPEKKV
jgi:two-component system alkaline phosphatase synthesis response regulator PhoP